MERGLETKMLIYPTLLSLVFVHVLGGDLSRCPPIVHQKNNFVESFMETCYMFINTEKYWTEARKDCWEMGGDMLEVDNEGTMIFIRSVLNGQKLGWDRNGVWLGAHDRKREGHWTWASGRPMKYSYWYDGQPKAILGLSFEDCACMRKGDDWKWHDYLCESLGFKYNFICQFRMAPTTTSTSTTPTTTVSALAKTEMAGKTILSYHVPGTSHTINVAIAKLSHREGSVQQGGLTARAYVKGGSKSDTDYHTGARKPDDEDDRSIMIAVILGSICFLVIILSIIFFFYCNRRKKKAQRADEPPQFENLSYGQLRQAEINENAANMASFTANQMNSLYEEVNKPVDHGVNYYTNMNGAGACGGAAACQPKVTNIEATSKENNATNEKVLEKPQKLSIVNNQLFDVDKATEGESEVPLTDQQQDDDHVYEDMQ